MPLAELQTQHAAFTPYTLLDALNTGVIALPPEADQTATVSSNVFVATKHPTSVVLRHHKLWLTVPDEDVRDYLVNYLRHPRWRGKAWRDVAEATLLPVRAEDRAAFTTAVQAQHRTIVGRLKRIDELDHTLDAQIFTLYGITDLGAQARMLGSAPPDEEPVAGEVGGDGGALG